MHWVYQNTTSSFHLAPRPFKGDGEGDVRLFHNSHRDGARAVRSGSWRPCAQPGFAGLGLTNLKGVRTLSRRSTGRPAAQGRRSVHERHLRGHVSHSAALTVTALASAASASGRIAILACVHTRLGPVRPAKRAAGWRAVPIAASGSSAAQVGGPGRTRPCMHRAEVGPGWQTLPVSDGAGKVRLACDATRSSSFWVRFKVLSQGCSGIARARYMRGTSIS